MKSNDVGLNAEIVSRCFSKLNDIHLNRDGLYLVRGWSKYDNIYLIYSGEEFKLYDVLFNRVGDSIRNCSNHCRDRITNHSI